jgi:peptidoglycan/LPS O-acetylase OafA/YrhL
VAGVRHWAYLTATCLTLEGVHTGETWRLGHRPGLDGLRGIAVLLVVAHHAGLSRLLPGLGSVGVTTFFVLSGYLIAGILISAHNAGRTITARDFLARRAVRLVPALALLLAVLAVVSSLGFYVADRAGFVSAAGFVSNWQILAGGGDQVGFLFPTWSLGVEAQFYALAAVAMIPTLRRWGVRGLFVLVGVGLVAATVVRLVLAASGASFDRVYYGTDTAMAPLLLGACVACAAALRVRLPRVRPALVLVALGVVTALPMEWWLPIPAALIAALVLVADAPVLRLEPLRFVGNRSYGLYLWHVPAIMLLGAPVGVPVAAVVTLLSWRYVERPLLRSRSADLVHHELGGVRGSREDVDGATGALVGEQFNVVADGEVVDRVDRDASGISAGDRWDADDGEERRTVQLNLQAAGAVDVVGE